MYIQASPEFAKYGTMYLILHPLSNKLTRGATSPQDYGAYTFVPTEFLLAARFNANAEADVDEEEEQEETDEEEAEEQEGKHRIQIGVVSPWTSISAAAQPVLIKSLFACHTQVRDAPCHTP
jgi:hypothetical protein